MLQLFSKHYECPLPTIRRNYIVIEKGSTVSESINSGEFVSYGKAATPLMLKSQIIIREVRV